MQPFLVATALLAWTLTGMAQASVKVCVAPLPATQFADEASKDRERAWKTVVDQLKRKKNTLTVVDVKEGADVLVELTDAAIVDGAVITKPNYVGGLKSAPQKEATVNAKLSTGDYSTDISSQHALSAIAAAQVADKIEKWVKDNRERILSSRK